MNMFILAEIPGKYDIGGVMSLTSILCLFIVAFAYSKGPIGGAGICATLCIVCALVTTEPNNAVDGVFVNTVANNPKSFIANESQTKWVLKPGGSELDEGIFYYRGRSTVSVLDDVGVYIPSSEMILDSTGTWKMRPDGRDIEDDDYYIYTKPFDPINVASSEGGGGIPVWLYHPAAPVWVFGIFGLPALLGGALIHSKLK